jgi:hypothetical protein
MASSMALSTSFQVAGYESETCDTEGVTLPQAQIPWRFRLRFFRSADDHRPLAEMLLTQRLSGSVQYACIRGTSPVLRLTEEWIDWLHPLCFDPQKPSGAAETTGDPAVSAPTEPTDASPEPNAGN